MQFYSLLGDFSTVPFDVAVIFPNSPRSALETWLARVPRRIGYARPWRKRLLTDPVPTRPGHVEMRKRSKKEIQQLISSPASPDTQHETRTTQDDPSRITHHASETTHHASHHIHDYLHLTASLGANPEPLAPSLEVAPDEVEIVETDLLAEARNNWKDFPSDTRPIWLALNPSAAYGPAKRWPADRFASVARQICEQFPAAIWITIGGPEDSALCNEVIHLANTRILNRAGNTGLRDLMAVLKLSRVLLTNDSGPMHVAAALDTPVVVPFGSTTPTITAPGLPGDPKHHLLSSNVPCSPCFLRECPIDFRCMTSISTDQVLSCLLTVVSSQA